MLAFVLQLPPGDLLFALALATILVALGAGVDLPADDTDA